MELLTLRRARRALLCLVALAPAAVAAPPVPLQALTPARPAPALSLPDLEARRLPLTAPGRVTILHFWATWCAPCREELPELAALAARGKDRAFAVVTVAADSPGKVREYIARHDLALPVRVDQYGDALFAWRVPALPASFVIDARGRVRYRAVGRVEWLGPGASQTLDALLAEAPGP
jgi:thiol-disulfide isomerase/thioredoxin